MGSTKVILSGWELDNPVIPASGTFGFGKEFAELYDINCLGTFSFKGTTRDARFGNPTPRIAECTAGMINSVGLQNPGVDHVIAHELPEMKKYFHKQHFQSLLQIMPLITKSFCALQFVFFSLFLLFLFSLVLSYLFIPLSSTLYKIERIFRTIVLFVFLL